MKNKKLLANVVVKSALVVLFTVSLIRLLMM